MSEVSHLTRLLTTAKKWEPVAIHMLQFFLPLVFQKSLLKSNIENICHVFQQETQTAKSFCSHFKRPQLFHRNTEMVIGHIFWWWLCSDVLLYFQKLLENLRDCFGLKHKKDCRSSFSNSSRHLWYGSFHA